MINTFIIIGLFLLIIGIILLLNIQFNAIVVLFLIGGLALIFYGIKEIIIDKNIDNTEIKEVKEIKEVEEVKDEKTISNPNIKTKSAYLIGVRFKNQKYGCYYCSALRSYKINSLVRVKSHAPKIIETNAIVIYSKHFNDINDMPFNHQYLSKVVGFAKDEDDTYYYPIKEKENLYEIQNNISKSSKLSKIIYENVPYDNRKNESDIVSLYDEWLDITRKVENKEYKVMDTPYPQHLELDIKEAVYNKRIGNYISAIKIYLEIFENNKCIWPAILVFLYKSVLSSGRIDFAYAVIAYADYVTRETLGEKYVSVEGAMDWDQKVKHEELKIIISSLRDYIDRTISILVGGTDNLLEYNTNILYNDLLPLINRYAANPNPDIYSIINNINLALNYAKSIIREENELD